MPSVHFLIKEAHSWKVALTMWIIAHHQKIQIVYSINTITSNFDVHYLMIIYCITTKSWLLLPLWFHFWYSILIHCSTLLSIYFTWILNDMIDTKVEVHLHIIYDVLGWIGEEQSIAVAKRWKSRARRLQEPAQIQLLIYALYLATDFLSINNTFNILR